MPFVVLLYAVDFDGHNYWATALFVARDDDRLVRRPGRAAERADLPLGSLLDPVADKILVISVLVVLIDQGVFPGWMVAAIVAREFLVSGLRLAAIERGVVMQARDLGKLKTWSQALAAAIGGFAAAGAWGDRDRLVGAPRRAGPDLGVGAGLRARRAEALARPGTRVGLDCLTQSRLPPCARVRRRHVSPAQQPAERDLDRLAALRASELGSISNSTDEALPSEVGEMEPPIEYVRTGDVSIAYQVMGSGPADLVYVPLNLSIAVGWQPIVARFYERLASFSRLIRPGKARDRALRRSVARPSRSKHRMDDVRRR